MDISHTYERFVRDALQMRSGRDVFGHLRKLAVSYEIASFSFIDLLEQPVNPSQLLSGLNQNANTKLDDNKPTSLLNPNIFLINASSILDIINSEWTPDQWVVIDLSGEYSHDVRHVVTVLFAHLQREYDIYIPACQPSANMSLVGFEQANLEDLPNISQLSIASTHLIEKANEKSRQNKSYIHNFTPMELGCISQAAEGMSNMEISQNMDISQAIIAKNLASISQKLKAKNRIQAISLAIRSKLI